VVSGLSNDAKIKKEQKRDQETVRRLQEYVEKSKKEKRKPN